MGLRRNTDAKNYKSPGDLTVPFTSVQLSSILCLSQFIIGAGLTLVRECCLLSVQYPLRYCRETKLLEKTNMAQPLSKSKIIAHMAEKLSISKKTTALLFDELLKLAVRETKGTGKFVIPGLGRAVKAHSKARMGRNPATGEAINIKAKTVVRLRAGKAFKDAILGDWHGPRLSGKNKLRGDYHGPRKNK